MKRRVYLLAWFLLGVVLVGLPMLATAGGAVFDNGGKLIGPPVQTNYYNNGTSWSTLTYANSGTGVVGSRNMLVPVTAGRAAVNVPIALSEKVLGSTIAKLGIGVLRGSIQGMVLSAGLQAAFNAAGIACDLTGCRNIVGTTAEDIPATQQPVNPDPTSWARSSGGSCGTGGPFLTSTACGQAAYPAKIWDHTQAAAPDQYVYMKDPNGQNIVYVSVRPTCPAGSSLLMTGVTSTGPYCTAVQTYVCPSNQNWTTVGSGASMHCTRPACPSGQARDATGVCVAQAITDDAAATLLEPKIPAADAIDTVQKAINANVPVTADQPTLTGPATSQSPAVVTTNTTNGVTTTTTNQTTITNNYAGNTYTYTINNTTVKKDAAGNVISNDVQPVEEAASVSDTPLGDIPKLYDRKYPNGMQGVWTQQKAALLGTPLASLQSVFAPSIGNGTCPTWTFNANIGPHMNYGSGVISPPCWIWDALKAIVIVSALFVARALVFGG